MEDSKNLCLTLHDSECESSKSMQDYLKAIVALSNSDDWVTTTQISRYLKIASPSVTSMLKKLSKNSYATYRPYHGITLTPKGIRESQKITRKHMLLEKLFSDVLPIQKSHIDSQACAMEHSISDDVEAALCRYLHHPDRCPDGKIIPACDRPCITCQECIALHNKGLQIVKRRQQNLHSIYDLKAKDTAKIAFIREEQPMLQRIFDMGLIIGTEVTIERIISANEAVEVKVGGSNVLMGQDVAAKVFVELISQ